MRRLFALLVLLTLLAGCGDSGVSSDEVDALNERLAALEQQLAETEAALISAATSSPTIAPATTTSSATTTAAATTTAPTTTTTVAIDHPDSTFSMGLLHVDMHPDEALSILGSPTSIDQDEWGDPIYEWELPGPAWIRIGVGNLIASCDPAGEATIPLSRGLTLCASTLTDLVDALGPPHSVDGEGQVFYVFDVAGNPWAWDSPVNPDHAIKAGAAAYDPEGPMPPPVFPPFSSALDDPLTWIWVYTSFY